LIGATDTHSSRAALTEMSVRAAIPYVDVGVRVGIRGEGQLDSLRSDRRVQIPGGPCLWCWGVLDPERIRLELMPAGQRAKLVAEGYATGQPAGPAPSIAALTVTAAGTAVSAVLGLITGAFDAAPLAVSLDALTLEAFPYARQDRDPDCVCSRWRPGTV
jgi:hypothetical protein